MPTRRTIIILLILVICAVAALISMRDSIAKQLYLKQGRSLAGTLEPELESKYGEELEYTLDKFWSCYKDGIVSQNDMTDVMDRIKTLRSQDKIVDLDIFKFIGYVSKIYTSGIKKNHEEAINRLKSQGG